MFYFKNIKSNHMNGSSRYEKLLDSFYNILNEAAQLGEVMKRRKIC